MTQRDYKEMYFKARRDAFVTNIAYAKSLILVNLILNEESHGNIKEAANDVMHAIEYATETLNKVNNGDSSLGIYMDLTDE
jgi:hypothetical protein